MTEGEVSTIEDAAAIAEIIAIDAASSPAPWSKQQWQAACGQKDAVQIFSVAGRIVAFSVWQNVLDECELLNIAVSPEHRQKGIAAEFLRKSLAQWDERGVKTVFLEVRASNLVAQALYARLGFVQNRLRKSYYKATATTVAEDAILMQRCL